MYLPRFYLGCCSLPGFQSPPGFDMTFLGSGIASWEGGWNTQIYQLVSIGSNPHVSAIKSLERESPQLGDSKTLVVVTTHLQWKVMGVYPAFFKQIDQRVPCTWVPGSDHYTYAAFRWKVPGLRFDRKSPREGLPRKPAFSNSHHGIWAELADI